MQQRELELGDLPHLAIVGTGRLGSVLARACYRGGYPVVACASRTHARAQQVASQVPGCQACSTASEAAAAADWVFLTVPDDSIPTVSAEIAWLPRHLALHCSGAQPAAAIAAAREAGARVAGFHPLQSFADPDIGVDRLLGSTIGIESDDSVWPQLARLASAVGAAPLRIRAEQRAAYHLGSVVVSNFTVGLLALATDLWTQIGIDEDTAVRSLLPLLEGTMRNIAELGVPLALTGPVVRGDVGTVERHLGTLRGRAGPLAAYVALSDILIELAEQQGRLQSGQAARLRALLYGEHGAPIPDLTPPERPTNRSRADHAGD